MKKITSFLICICILLLTGCESLPGIIQGETTPSPTATEGLSTPTPAEVTEALTPEPTPEVFASEVEREAAGIIDSSIELAIKAVQLNRTERNPDIMKSTYYEPFEEDLSWIESFSERRKELFHKLTDAGKKREDLIISEKEYGSELVIDYLTIATAVERYDPFTSCFCYADISGNDLVICYFDPHKDANYCVERDSEGWTRMENDLTLFEAVLARVLKKMPSDLSTYEKYYYLASVVSARVEYSLEPKNRANAFGALIDGKALCEGYAEAFYLLCKEANLACYLQSGTTPEGGHAWNLIALEGGTYHVDVTWCDNYEPGDWRWNMYFAMTDDEAITCGHELREGRPATGKSY